MRRSPTVASRIDSRRRANWSTSIASSVVWRAGPLQYEETGAIGANLAAVAAFDEPGARCRRTRPLLNKPGCWVEAAFGLRASAA